MKKNKSNKTMVVEYGIMSNKWSVEAGDKLTAYACIILHLNMSAKMVALYSPKEIVKNDSWLFTKNLEARLDEIFGGDGEFKKFVESHVNQIRECSRTIKKLI